VTKYRSYCSSMDQPERSIVEATVYIPSSGGLGFECSFGNVLFMIVLQISFCFVMQLLGLSSHSNPNSLFINISLAEDRTCIPLRWPISVIAACSIVEVCRCFIAACCLRYQTSHPSVDNSTLHFIEMRTDTRLYYVFIVYTFWKEFIQKSALFGNINETWKVTGVKILNCKSLIYG
jgi:hypothetical protein